MGEILLWSGSWFGELLWDTCADVQSKPPPLPEKRDASLPTGWTYFGCVTESYNERLLEGFAFSSFVLTPEMCLNQCSKMGFTMAGTEYGDEVSLRNVLC